MENAVDGDFKTSFASDYGKSIKKKQWFWIDLVEESIIVNITIVTQENNNRLYKGGFFKVC